MLKAMPWNHSTWHGSMSRGKIFYPASPHQISIYHLIKFLFTITTELILWLFHLFQSICYIARHFTDSRPDFFHSDVVSFIQQHFFQLRNCFSLSTSSSLLQNIPHTLGRI
jgi:hypothetical protein